MTLEPRIDRLEAEVSQISQRVDQLGQRVASLEGAVGQLNNEIQGLRSDISSRLNILTLVVFGNVAATILSAVGLVVAVLVRN